MASRYKGLVWSSGLAASLLLGASPLAAQENSSAAQPPSAPAPADNIGPRELQNFSLEGTVTRRAEEPAAQPVAPPAREEARRDAAPPTPETVRPGVTRSAAAPEAQPTRRAQAAATDPIAGRPTLRQAPSRASRAAAAAAAPALSTPVTMPTPIEAPGGFSPLPWIAALLLLGAGAVIYFGRQRRRQGYAAAGVSEFVAVEEPRAVRPAARVPAPAPPSRQPPVRRTAQQRAPAPEPAGVVKSSLRTAPKAPPGVVTTSLRPWIELELEPSQAMVTDEHAAIAFDVTLFNSGSAPARDVAVEACLINANQQQDVQLSQFYSSPGAVHDKIPSVAPMSRITLKSAVRLPRAAVQEYEVEGRKLFMPMVAINSRYRWSSGEGQSAASFLVGSAANDSAKLAPLRLDTGRRGWKGLAARRYEKGIRR